jgi:DNA-binding Lrp family transcriptional regulator
MNSTAATSWRDKLPVHPAADLFPMMERDELLALGKDIEAGGVDGLRMPITVIKWAKSPVKFGRSPVALLDGRNRLDALEAAGYKINFTDGGMWEAERKGEIVNIDFAGAGSADPYDLVLSLNIRRRHLTSEQKRELIEKLLKAKPGQSNRAIAKQVNVDHKTVGAVRDKLEQRGEIPHVSVTTDTKGRKQPTKKKRRTGEDEPDDQDIEADVEPENYRVAFLLRADQARQFAAYSGPITSKIVEMSRQVGRAWLQLAADLERKAREGGAP